MPGMRGKQGAQALAASSEHSASTVSCEDVRLKYQIFLSRILAFFISAHISSISH